jgi:nucleoside-diphosphate-sugar epimerase
VELVRLEFDGALDPVFDPDPTRADEVSAAANTQLVLAKLGWAATTPLEEGVQRTVDWHRRCGVSHCCLC